MIKWASRFFKHLTLKFQGFGACSECGYCWGAVESKNIDISDGSAMFPVCHDCFEKLSPKQIMRHVLALCLRWSSVDRNVTSEDVKSWCERANKEILAMKGVQNQ